MSVTLLPPKSLSGALLFSLLSLSAQAPAGAAVGTTKPPTDSVRYQRCIAASNTAPATALGDATDWARSGGGIAAEHCAALALVSLRRYVEAGEKLDRIAGAKNVPDISFRTELSSQAGNAWLLAGNGARAVQSFTSALTLSAGDADLFADLARAHAMRRNWNEVVLDLNAALQLSPRRADLLVLRASARRALGRHADCRADIEAALKIKPGDAGALVERALLRKQLGDLGGARRDLQAALKSSPEGAVAAAARENLDSLN